MNGFKSFVRGMLSVYSCDFDIFRRSTRPNICRDYFSILHLFDTSVLKSDTEYIAQDCAKVAKDICLAVDNTVNNHDEKE
jgi:hypothetical protein